MAEHITINKAAGTWVVRAGGAVIGESKDALELHEGSYPAVIYFPRGDIAMAFMDASDKVTTCPHKGQASYFSIQAKSGPLPDAVWSYETPIDAVDRIAGHLAFDTSRVTVERV